jgi:hypothetical protein
MLKIITYKLWFAALCITVAFANFYVGCADYSLDAGGEFVYSVIGVVLLLFGVWVAASTLDD